MNCGYDVLSHLTGGTKTPAELRTQACAHILDHPSKFNGIQAATEWLVQRHPEESNANLMVGGFQKRKICEV